MTEQTDWQPISSAPEQPCAVVFLTTDYKIVSFPEGRTIDNPHIRSANPLKAEPHDLGYWDGSSWYYAGTNHEVFEFGDEFSTPTHWMPLPPPPQEG